VRAALAFLTCLPVGAPGRVGDLSRGAAWFPAVGALVGAAMAATHALADLMLSDHAAVLLAVLVAILLTRGLHEDGLADTADAVGAHTTRARRLEILRDPRVGTFGALALVFAVALPVTVLAPLDAARFVQAAVAGHVLGRWSALPLALLVRPARPDGAGVLLSGHAGATAAGTAFAVVLVLAAAGPAAGGAALAVAAGLTTACAVAATRALGGTTGDLYGATNKLVELAAYVVLAGLWH
jgi:adenosylcobinamide-GDP ribazoletransferase